MTIESSIVSPTDSSVLAHQGIPASADLSDRTRDLILQARELFLSLAEPKVVTRELSTTEFESVYYGEGKNDSEDPLGVIFQKASHLMLFVVTLSQPLCDRISRLVEENDLAAGSMLDSVASEGADGVAEEVQRRWYEELVEANRVSEDQAVLRYSPGYCGWHISGQKRIFELLKPESIGVSLNDSFLMSPIKSVSGVMVAAPKDCFRYDDNFHFCADCRNHSCQERNQSL